MRAHGDDPRRLAHHVHVDDVELEKEIVRADAADDVDACSAGKKETGHVTGVDGLDEQPDARGVESARRIEDSRSSSDGRRRIQAAGFIPARQLTRIAERRRTNRAVDPASNSSIRPGRRAYRAHRPSRPREVVKHLFQTVYRQTIP